MTTTLPRPTANARPLGTRTGPTTPAGGGEVECLCPFCGAFNAGVGQPCRHCRTEDTTAARAAARKRVGPWFVLNARNPAAPGLSLTALTAMIRSGLVTDRSVIRGPATGQLWRLAGKVRGISREFGCCYGCGGDLYAADPVCPHCQRPQSLPADIDAGPADPAAGSFVPAQPDRPLNRQDLLTPRDVAKAFSLGFNPAAPGTAPTVTTDLNELLPPNGPGGPSVPKSGVVAGVATVAVLATLAAGWAVMRGLNPQPTPTARVTVHTARPLTAATPSRPTLHVDPLAPPEPVVRPALLVRAEPARPDAAPSAAIDNAATPAAANEPAGSDPSDSADNPKQLMVAGLAAEARGDYAAAVQQYERIESLSADEWPAGLKDRLTLARSAARTGDRD